MKRGDRSHAADDPRRPIAHRHQRTEALLRANAHKLRNLFDDAPDAILLLDLDGSIIDANRKAIQQLGYDLAKLTTLHFLDLPPHTLRPQARDILAHFVADGTVVAPIPFQHQRGSTFPAEVSIQLIDVGDELPIAQAIVRDISQLKHAEEAMRRYEHMVAATDDLMVFIDKDYIFRSINLTFLHIIGKQSDAVVGRAVKEVMGGTLFHDVIKERIDLALSGRTISRQSWVDLPKLGRRYLDARYFPYRAEDEVVTGVVAVLRDITQRRNNQTTIAALAAHEDVVQGRFEPAARILTRTLAETLDVDRVGIWLFEDQKEMFRCAMLYEKSRLQYKQGRKLPAEAIHFVQALQRSSTVEIYDVATDPRAQEMRTYFKKRKIASLLAVPLRVGGEVVGFLSHSHVGAERSWQADEIIFASEMASLLAQALVNQQRQELEARLLQAQKMESLGVLAGGIAHDFNNLLVGILGGSDLALDALREGRAADAHLELIRQSATRASELCAQLLAYAGRHHLVRQVVSLTDLIQDTVPLVEGILAPEITVEYQLTATPVVEIDPTQMRQVVMNLVTNASDALGGQPGALTIASGRLEHDADMKRSSLRPAELAAGRYAYLDVTDTGCGMDAATRSRVFDPFFTTKFTGRGLGLAAAQGIVRGHGGAIGIRSEVGRGTTFRILLPASDKALDTAPPHAVKPPRDRDEGLILVVDDEPAVRTTATLILERRGYQVIQAADGQSGIDLFRAHANDIDAVLLDITMPVMDGEEALRAMRSIRQDVNVVLSSGFSEETAAQRFAGYELASFLQKPYRADALLAKIRHVLTTTTE